MTDQIMQKLTEHDSQLAQINKRFDEHDKRFDEHDKRFDEHDKRFDRIDSQIDWLAKKTLEHDDRLERIEQNMATKDDLGKITTTLDKLVVLFEKKDQELVALVHLVRRHEDVLEQHGKEIKQMKPLLGLA